MGRLIKNYQFRDGVYASRLQVGDGAMAPSAPQNGHMRFNSSTLKVEAYYSGAWRELTQAGRVEIIKDSFTGNATGGQVDFTMSFSDAATYVGGNAQAVMVFAGGVFQNPEVSYTILNTILTFSVAPADGVSIIVLHNLNSTIVD
jgi:hypothetical protein